MSGFFRANQERAWRLRHPDWGVYMAVMARINYGEPGTQMGVPVAEGQCIVTMSLLAQQIGVDRRTIGRIFHRLGCHTEPVKTTYKGFRGVRVTVPQIWVTELMGSRDSSTHSSTYGSTKRTVKPAVPQRLRDVTSSDIAQPIAQPMAQQVLNSTELNYKNLTQEVCNLMGTVCTPGIEAELRNLSHPDQDIMTAITTAYSSNPPRSSVTGWIRTVIAPLCKQIQDGKSRPERQHHDFGPVSDPEITRGGILKLREALDAVQRDTEDESAG